MLPPTLPHARRGPVAALICTLLSLPFSACLQFESSTCPSGLVCAQGMQCAARQDICIPNSPTCGDGIVQEGEACDDGNLVSRDGCASDCKSNETCGNNFLDPDEACDDGNNVDGDKCSADCKHSALCGNGIIDPGEECDDQNTSDSDDCLSTCLRAKCGDGFLHKDGTHTEECDPTTGTEECTPNCKLPSCGDRIVTPAAGEECDPPGPHGDFTCDSKCRLAFCGNGHKDDGEECDDGPNNGKGPCLDNCKNNTCGDGHLDPFHEQCDDGAANGASTCRYGEKSCTVCTKNCTKMNIRGSFCGDGVVDGAEETCDLGPADCGTCIHCQTQEPAQASGTLTVEDASALNDGDVLILSDGTHMPVTFVFTTDSSCNDGSCSSPTTPSPYCCIKLHWHRTNQGIADSIQTTIGAAHTDHLLDIEASHVDTSTVTLNQTSPGGFGNQGIYTNRSNAFSLKSFSGGIGFTCPMDSPCNNDQDCTPGLKCNPSDSSHPNKKKCVPE